ncbi:hypothetical protein KUL25_20655 [Rhodobacteraceae bacterium N5(2021)]|uniref:Uncharacterized protein n=1 Tax=Gymnodinialimonas phycosphaerae TaxID=2841589 RepID=A0A975TV56_9RHOB|nr:hypothetical protein [Gymnodinialimonas phycosphaerae]MBY4895180.1 hypothetical protein [Gymnodinialimonas phycosphaerae]
MAAFAAGGAVAQDGPRPAAIASGIAQECLRLSDAAIEQSLADDLAEADQAVLVETFEQATFECLGLSMEICEWQEAGVACLGDLAAWVRTHRAAIVARLADVTLSEPAALARAGAEADTTTCDHMSDAERERYCEIVSEGVALEDAYGAWRMARREGAVDLVGHDPIDLERLQ